MTQTITGDDQQKTVNQTSAPRNTVDFTRRVLIIVGIVTVTVLLLALLWYGLQVLLLGFAGLLLAIFLRGLGGWLSNYLPISPAWGVGLVLVIIMAVLGLGGYFLAPQLNNQVNQLVETLPQTIQEVRSYLQNHQWGRFVLAQTPSMSEIARGQGNVLGRITGVFSATLGILTNFLVILFAGLFFSFESRWYVDGLTRLVPARRRDRVEQTLHAAGYALQWWLIARLVSMSLIGVLTAVGLMIIGIPFALALGFLTGTLTFIPIIGSTLAIVPALLLALTQSPTQALYVLIFYLFLQTIESYLITPLIQERAISLPPALVILFQVLLGVVAGMIGIALATPLLAVIIVAVKMLYIRGVLSEPVEVKGA